MLVHTNRVDVFENTMSGTRSWGEGGGGLLLSAVPRGDARCCFVMRVFLAL